MAEPGGDEMAARLQQALLERGTVMLRGPLDDEAVSRVAAQLLWLGRRDERRVELHLDSPGGPLSAAFTLIDTIDALGVPVRARCLGRVEGAAVGVVVACDHRTASRHTRFRLSEPPVELSGRVADLEQAAVLSQREVADFAARIGAATGRPAEHVEAELAAGRYLDAEEALAYGLIHEISSPGAGRARRPPGAAPMGFGP
jgi:ATP-dependent Clp protease protease subunit